ncbi:3800_t:CDS:2, partial [Paraglomus brasilianum]
MKVLSSLGILDEEELPEETIMQSVEGSNEGEANIVDVSSMSAEVDDQINQTINESDVEDDGINIIQNVEDEMNGEIDDSGDNSGELEHRVDEARRDHTILRELAIQQVQRNANLMENLAHKRNKKRQLVFGIGESVRILIPRIDRTGIDQRSLPCKVLEVLEGGFYRLGCAHGVLNSCYQPCNMESISGNFTELDNIPNNRISLTEAARLQSSAVIQGS